MLKNNKNFALNKGNLILGILFVLVSVIAFVIPTEKTATFWVAYVFTVVAFAAQIFVWKKALGKEGELKSKFLGIPVVHVGIVYLVLQVIAFAVFVAFPILPVWSVIVVCAIIIGISALCTITADVAIEEIERVEVNVQKKVFYIKSLQADVELLAEAEKDEAVKAELLDLAKRIRFSDPMSNEELAPVEEQVVAKINELKTSTDKQSVINSVLMLLAERNKKCKLLK